MLSRNTRYVHEHFSSEEETPVVSTPVQQQQQQPQQQQEESTLEGSITISDNKAIEEKADADGSSLFGIAIGIVIAIIIVNFIIAIVLTIFGLKTRKACITGNNQSPIIGLWMIISLLCMWFTPLSPFASIATLVMIIIGSSECKN